MKARVLAVSALAVLVLAGGVSADSILTLERGSQADVVADDDGGVLSIDAESEVRANESNQQLVVLTNPTDKQQSISVTLSTGTDWQFNSTGTRSYSVSLSPGDSITLYVDVGEGASTGTKQYSIDSGTSWFSFNQERTVTVQPES